MMNERLLLESHEMHDFFLWKIAVQTHPLIDVEYLLGGEKRFAGHESRGEDLFGPIAGFPKIFIGGEAERRIVAVIELIEPGFKWPPLVNFIDVYEENIFDFFSKMKIANHSSCAMPVTGPIEVIGTLGCGKTIRPIRVVGKFDEFTIGMFPVGMIEKASVFRSPVKKVVRNGDENLRRKMFYFVDAGTKKLMVVGAIINDCRNGVHIRNVMKVAYS